VTNAAWNYMTPTVPGSSPGSVFGQDSSMGRASRTFHQTVVVTNAILFPTLRRMPMELHYYRNVVAGSIPAGSIFDGAVAQR